MQMVPETLKNDKFLDPQAKVCSRSVFSGTNNGTITEDVG